jgi:hypothetical protein
MRKKTNHKRTLDQIAAAIHAAESESLFARGDLLIEAKETYPGEFLAWLEDNFWWSHDTAERFMKVSRLGANFAILRNLKLARTTLYELCDYEGDELKAIVAELAKHAKQKWLKSQEAWRYIEIAQARLEHGDKYSDATLFALGSAHEDCDALLKAANPKTDAAAELIVKQFKEKREEAKAQARLAEIDAWANEEQVEDVEPEDVETKPVKPKEVIEPKPVAAQPMPGGVGPMLSLSPEDELLDKAAKALALAEYDGAGTITDELVDACDQAATAWQRLHSTLRKRQNERDDGLDIPESLRRTPKLVVS